MTLMALPSLEGDSLTLTVTRALVTSAPLTDVNKVIFKVTPQDINGGSTSYEGTRSDVGSPELSSWNTKDQIFSLDGAYLVTAIVQRTQSADVKGAFRLELSEEKGLTAAAADVVDVRVTTDPSPPISGTATLILTAVDGAGAPIEGATLTTTPLMPSHAHAEPVTVAGPVAGKPGVYSMPVHFTMGGGWLLVFDVSRPGHQTVKTDASLDVIDPNATPTPGGAGSP